MKQLSNYLTDLADRVKSADRAAADAARVTIEQSLEAGRLLLQAKAQCPHGQWLPFLERAGLGAQRAQRWMRLAGAGLEMHHVTYLGGIRATLEFLSRWRLPAFEEALFISDAKFDGSYSEVQSVGRGIAYVWEAEDHPGHYWIGYIAGEPGGDDECVCTRRPILPRSEMSTSVDKPEPIDLVVAFLDTAGFPLPMADWNIGFVPRRFPPMILPPFFTDRTLVEAASTNGGR